MFLNNPKLSIFLLNVLTVMMLYITTNAILWSAGLLADVKTCFLGNVIFFGLLLIVAFCLHQVAFRKIKIINQGLSELTGNPNYRFKSLPGLWGGVSNKINQLADELTETRVLMDKVLSNLPVAVMVLDEENNIKICNPTAKQYFRCQDCQDCNNNRFDHKKKCPYKLLEWTKNTNKSIRNYDYYLDFSDGEKRHLLINTRVILDAKRKSVSILLTATDITTRIQMWDQIQQTEKISMISELAAGVAHEIKNPLTSARGLLQLINDRFKEEDVARQHIGVALESLNRINVIINEMEQLSLPNKSKLVFSQLEHLLEEIFIIINGEAVCHNITIKRIYQSNLPLAVIDVNQMKQVFLNLAINAINAMPNGGVLTISVNYYLSSNEFEINFADNGIGMSKEEIKKIFNPFYSSSANNTGLGLTVCYQTIKSHGGHIAVQSELGKGSNITIYLPAVNQTRNIS